MGDIILTIAEISGSIYPYVYAHRGNFALFTEIRPQTAVFSGKTV